MYFELFFAITKSFLYIVVYTLGFIPTLNFRYGKSYGRTADDSMCDFNEHLRRKREARQNKERMYRAATAPKMKPLRSADEVNQLFREYEDKNKFKGIALIVIFTYSYLCTHV